MTDPRRFEEGPPPAPPTTVPAMIARRLDERPDAPAVETDGAVLSYAELDRRAGALAGHLRPLATGDDPVVALVLERGPELVTAMLAAWKAGCAFSPIDPRTPAARIGYVLDDLQAFAVVTATGSRAALPDHGTPVVDVTAAGPPMWMDTVPVSPDATAYVLYTSGTTGTPKGVAISHRGLAQAAAWCIEECGFGPTDRVSQVSSVGFDAAQLEIWPCLAAGGCLLPYRRAVQAAELAAWLDERRVTRGFLVTPLAEAVWSLPDPLPHLETMLIGGAALTRRPPDPVPYPIRNLYGPTECTIFATSHPVAGEVPLNVIGRPVAGARVYILDEDGDRCPVDEPGEIHIGGVGVARGYWRRPALTQQRFMATDPDGRPGPVYRTGDRGRWRPDGSIEFLGRLDRQLEVRGYRVEPGEVEAALRADPAVAAALVHPVPGDRPARLAAYLVPRPGLDRDSAAVLARLARRLPDHLVPDYAVWLDELPLTERGKVDEARLPRPTRADAPVAGDPVAPADGLERRIAAVWARVLSVDAVGAHDNFFDVGGNSLLLVSLRAELQAELATPIAMSRLFEHATVRALARSLTDEEGGLDDPRERAVRARRARAARRSLP